MSLVSIQCQAAAIFSLLAEAGARRSPLQVLLSIAIVVFYYYALARIFMKAGIPGWKAIVPIYNLYIMTKLVFGKGWYMILFFVPIVNLIITFIWCIKLAEAYGKDSGFGLGLFFLSFIFIPILAFGDANYIGEYAISSTTYGNSQYPYAQNGYSQGGYYQQGGYSQNGYQQGNYQQGNYSQNGYQQGGYQQGNYQQGGYSQNGYQQGSYTQDGYQQNGYSQNDFYQSNFSQQDHDPNYNPFEGQ